MTKNRFNRLACCLPLLAVLATVPAEVIEEPGPAFARAVDLAGGEGVVVVTGSIHLAGVLRPLARTRAAVPDLDRMVVSAKE